MPIAAEAVPGLLHVSLFLFFVGLADSTLNINTTIGVTTTVPIGICGSLYIFTTLAPVIYPQSPYQTSFSGAIWYAIQKLHGRIFKDRDGKSKSVSTNMAQGQLQLSMEETKKRKGRDKRAIRWLLDNTTEDAEIESLAMSIPSNFNGEWSFEVWRELSKEEDLAVVAQPLSLLKTIRNVLGLIPRQFRKHNPSRSPTDAMIHQPTLHSTNIHHPIVTTSIRERNTVFRISRHVGHLFETCKNRAVFASDELWRRRARTCVEATESLVSFADAELNWFGDILRTLGDIGSFEEMGKLLLSGRDRPFVARWTCLSIMAIREILRSNVLFKEHVKLAVASLGEVQHGDGTDEAAEKNARKIDETLGNQWRHKYTDSTYYRVSTFTDTMWEIDGMQTFLKFVDSKTVDPNETSNIFTSSLSQRALRQSPFIQVDFPDSEPFLRQTFEIPDLLKGEFNSCRQFLNEFFDHVYTKEYHEGWLDSMIRHASWPKKLLQQTLWRLQDLRDGDGLGFGVELFFTALKQLLSTSSSQESYSTLYLGTFRAIISDWRRYKNSLGTQKLLLDAVASDQGFLRTFYYPDYIKDEFWKLLGDILEGQTGPHIDSAVRQLTDYQRGDGVKYGAKASAVISQLRASCSR